MKYVAVNFNADLTGSLASGVKHIYGFGGLLKNAIRELRELRKEKEKQGIKVFNITVRSFETDEPIFR